MDQTKQDEDYGYELFPERHKEKHKKSLVKEALRTFNHQCQFMLHVAMETSPYAKLLLSAMNNSGCPRAVSGDLTFIPKGEKFLERCSAPDDHFSWFCLKSKTKVSKDRHFSCEDCDGTVSGGFDATSSQIVLCQNNIHQQAHMNRVVTHELIHAFDHCRAHVDWFNNFRHLACSEIRAANLSGDCSFTNEASRFNLGLKEHHQECVRGRALRSILAVRKVSREEAQKIVDEVFDSCFNDHAPFGRIPHSKKDAKFAYRDYMNGSRYYAYL